ncbi:MAG: HAD hydrolase-like protein [Carboxylicivirga sp.]|jgi:phosphoglycolate phosphatase/pyrophosphatase PpaX|nr:HAD hydrolase-like protein [Carboxylicivirga sp.]MCT4645184.1 HAD hydrolase-like protein [Carboxylicivirga sp.]
MKSIKAIVFDLDGTVGDTVPLCIKAFRKSIEPLINQRITDDQIKATFGPSEEGTILALAPNHYERGITDYLNYYDSFHDICPVPFEGIEELLDTLKEKNIRIAMVTGKGKYSTEISLKKFGLEKYFEIVETGIAGGARKPECLQNVINRYPDLSKNQIIYIGDAPSDIIACRVVGIPIVAAAWAPDVEKEELASHNPDKIFDTVSDLKEWILSNI